MRKSASRRTRTSSAGASATSRREAALIKMESDLTRRAHERGQRHPRSAFSTSRSAWPRCTKRKRRCARTQAELATRSADLANRETALAENVAFRSGRRRPGHSEPGRDGRARRRLRASSETRDATKEHGSGRACARSSTEVSEAARPASDASTLSAPRGVSSAGRAPLCKPEVIGSIPIRSMAQQSQIER